MVGQSGDLRGVAGGGWNRGLVAAGCAAAAGFRPARFVSMYRVLFFFTLCKSTCVCKNVGFGDGMLLTSISHVGVHLLPREELAAT